ncbi:type II CAAX prenyl endopeptidase Rce1 family protein [Halorussus caseinilyticus]|uniref:CPBP family glutamic-type intramembrane protease n=1 Tax=Halorussus caseinilyticus TaxID=3034025 RepID=UPI0023E8EFFA|nr:CPBP family glutamic-type intramembrane protease [Halorussus sp. DT72]
MLRSDTNPPTFERRSVVPVATYVVTIAVLTGLLLVSPSHSPVLGMVWGVFLVGLGVGALTVEGISPRSILPPVRTLVPAIAVLVAFWALYNLVAFGLALGGVSGFETTGSKAAAHPALYLGALLSSLLFTAIPEELVFRAYLQQKFTALADGETRRTVATGVAVAAVLFALFHLPRWFLGSGHGVGTALAVRLLGLTLMGIAYGVVYALTGNLWLVALFHATMNQPPFVVTVSVPAELHLLVGVVEYAAIVSTVYVAVRVTEPEESALVWSRRAASSTSD